MERIQRQRRRGKKEPEPQALEADTKQALKDAFDEVLDDIDGILEQNAEELVRNYVQKGGE